MKIKIKNGTNLNNYLIFIKNKLWCFCSSIQFCSKCLYSENTVMITLVSEGVTFFFILRRCISKVLAKVGTVRQSHCSIINFVSLFLFCIIKTKMADLHKMTRNNITSKSECLQNSKEAIPITKF